ncbi:MAG TPA: ABC-F family ATP-binding cassette domain-containing protein [Bacteroidaceae bacterium]|nr:ABC-F family ATP-binding cassette domain-containing protein [Bacteroidaceae bacterium]
MISADNLKVEFGAVPLFSDVSFVINDKERVALVGKNGAGKSTLLKILAGLQKPNSGIVSTPKDVKIGYLPQVMRPSDSKSVKEEAETAFVEIRRIFDKVERLKNQIVERTDYESDDYRELIDTYARENDRLSMMGGDNYHAELEQTLLGLGFKRSDFDRPTKEFSGGWRMRIELAKLLLVNPDILLLDEPTNHLDIESIQWLENFLIKRGNAVLLVSHDKAFINNVTNRTIEISCGKIYDYKVKYDEFILLRKERREQQIRAFENQQREIANIKEFIERFRYKPTKSIQVQNRVKVLEKIVPIVIDEEDNKTLRLKFPKSVRSGSYPVICDSVGKKYGDHTVFSDVNMTINRGEKVAFVGRNGEGKSTFVKCIMGEIPFDGNLTIAYNTHIGYYAQNQAQMLDDDLTVFQTIDNVAVGEIRSKIRDILGAFMFGGDSIDKKVKVLSGGERSRLAMIRLLLTSVNLLILDEPTNHLDLASKEVLKEAILAFDGTAVIVSHDREFLDGLVTKIYEFGEGKVQEHLGGIYEFLRKKTPDFFTNIGITPASDTSQSSLKREKVSGRADYEIWKEQERKKRILSKRLEKCEKRVNQILTDMREIEKQLHTSNGLENHSMISKYSELTVTLKEVEAEWEKVMIAIES